MFDYVFFVNKAIGVSGSLFRGGHVFCQAAVPSFSTKLSCQWVNIWNFTITEKTPTRTFVSTSTCQGGAAGAEAAGGGGEGGRCEEHDSQLRWAPTLATLQQNTAHCLQDLKRPDGSQMKTSTGSSKVHWEYIQNITANIC